MGNSAISLQSLLTFWHNLFVVTCSCYIGMSHECWTGQTEDLNQLMSTHICGDQLCLKFMNLGQYDQCWSGFGTNSITPLSGEITLVSSKILRIPKVISELHVIFFFVKSKNFIIDYSIFSCESSSRNANVRLSVSQSVCQHIFFQLIKQPYKHETS